VGKGERAHELVEEAAAGISSVNEELGKTLAAQPALAPALEKNAEVEDKVQAASEELSEMNGALKAAVHERRSLDAQLKQVTHTSLHDPLTGLANRALFADRLEHGLAQAKRHGWLLAVMFFDLDGFKGINDRFGHEAGDTVLRTVAARLKENTRSDDTVSRHGGDEFLYLLLEVSRTEDTAAIAQKLADLIAQPCEVPTPDGPTSLSVSASIGIALYPSHGTTCAELIAKADAAMYAAKRGKAGRAFSFAGEQPALERAATARRD
jgi:diguanylate cyclase (GGDEF)-like protein